MPFATLHDGLRLRYREAGRDRPGPPLLLIHGAGASSAVWLGVMHRLARTRRVVAIDLPGHGQSGGAPRSIDEMRDAVGLLAATLCLGPSVLVGHSMGGLVALAAALAWPDKIAGLALVASAARLKVSEPFLAVIRDQWPRMPAFLAEGAYSPETPADVRRRGAGIQVAASHEQTLADYAAIAAADYRERLGDLRAPTLVVLGQHDVIVPPKWTRGAAEAIAGARLVELPRCGHTPPHEAPDALAELLRGFGVTPT
jgi:pimeloyl-ACP methyl ester carboxylesterase